MILYNTSFHIDSSIEREFIDWLKTEAVEAHLGYGMKDPMLARLLTSVAEGCSSFALHVYADSDETVCRWEGEGRPGLLELMNKRWGERALAFSTAMEIVDL